MFKIIGIRIHEGCNESIRKILKEEKSYFLYNDYEDDLEESKNHEWNGIRRRKKNIGVVPPDDFYHIEENEKNSVESPNVNISAIVGKNGSGKSTIVEIMIRIINNFAFKAGFAKNRNNLVWVKGLRATLFYSIDRDIYYITCLENSCIWRINNEKNVFLDKLDTIKDTLFSNHKEVFYSIITNYSMFAYNSLSFKEEGTDKEDDDEDWMASLFHKNDEYLIPIVLNPMRTKGNFDVNTEKNLTTQRLMALFTDAGNEKMFMAQNAVGYIYSLEKKSKFYTVSMESFFRKTFRKNILKFGSFNSNSRDDIDIIPKIDIDSHLRLWRICEKKVVNNRELFVVANKIIKNIRNESGGSEMDTIKTDLSEYILYCENLKNSSNIIEDYNKVDEMLYLLRNVDEICLLINFIQLQHLLLIIDIWDCWKEEKVIDEKKSIGEVLNSNDPRHHAMLYLAYKTISIFETYGDFKSLTTEGHAFLFKRINEFVFEDNPIKSEFKKLFSSLNKEKSFEILKLKQTINYLKQHNTLGKTKKHLIYGYECFLSFGELLDQINKVKIKNENETFSTIELLPPPIFNGDILFSAIPENGKTRNLSQARYDVSSNKLVEYYTLKMKSSGEQQLMFNVGNLIYHLRNLNSMPVRKGSVAYSNVNVILDEVELYFHPEYQRKYIDYLLKSIAHARLDRIKNINICCITHSPFILSDIPKNNVLFLDDGNAVRAMQEDTFGANIHTLLRNGFFLDSLPIGEFAKEKINKLFEQLHNHDGKVEENDDLYKCIQLVSEPVLKSQLLRLYNQLRPNNLNSELEELKNKVELLSKEIEKLKKINHD